MSGILLLSVCLLQLPANAQSIFTYAGGGTDDGRPATLAGMYGISSIVLDTKGNFYVTDTKTARIRKVSAATGIIETVAGNGTWGPDGDGGSATAAGLSGATAVLVSPDGDLYIAESGGDP